MTPLLYESSSIRFVFLSNTEIGSELFYSNKIKFTPLYVVNMNPLYTFIYKLLVGRDLLTSISSDTIHSRFRLHVVLTSCFLEKAQHYARINLKSLWIINSATWMTLAEFGVDPHFSIKILMILSNTKHKGFLLCITLQLFNSTPTPAHPCTYESHSGAYARRGSLALRRLYHFLFPQYYNSFFISTCVRKQCWLLQEFYLRRFRFIFNCFFLVLFWLSTSSRT